MRRFTDLGIVIILLFVGFGALLIFEGVAAAYPWAEHVRQSWCRAMIDPGGAQRGPTEALVIGT